METQIPKTAAATLAAFFTLFAAVGISACHSMGTLPTPGRRQSQPRAWPSRSAATSRTC